jgi:ABC-2 type transport system permease protein
MTPVATDPAADLSRKTPTMTMHMSLKMSGTYLFTELKRTYRNPRYMLFTLGIPLVLFLVIGNAWNTNIDGVTGQTWYMVNMGMFGSMGAALGIGARIAIERDVGWNRQLRLTPLPAMGYVIGKVITGMLTALPALLLVDLAGALSGKVNLSALQWAEVVGLGWISVLPLAVVGVGIGYLARGDSAQAVNGGLVMLLALFGGLWFPIDASAPQWLQSVAHAMPTYWITTITRAPISHQWPAAGGWLVLLAWAVVAARIAARRYNVDDLRAA